MDDVNKKNTESFSTAEAVRQYSSSYLRGSELAVIEKYAVAGKKVLDVGCGTGRTTVPIHELGAEVIGVDVSAPMIEKAKELHPNIDFRVMDALNLSFSDGTFDFVFFSFNGLDNLYPKRKRREALLEMKRVLKSGGVLAYSSHNGFAVPHTAQGWKMLTLNFLRLRPFPHYRNEYHGFGNLIQYYGNMISEKKMIRSVGMTPVEILSNGKVARMSRWFQFFLERFPMYICQK